ncbi:PEP-utilizing enzyme [Cytobacillus sp. NCCP-133]|uniref:PEP-utilizing enzyme n=1 Tax=Cytobacillus sp. NCCP-133 TaxID=766848 RepID=UPI00223065CE|nr:PEP-utilizing enzyme [Cytobacillus sp. NCCP-133]GLB60963.1 hypothetical protein NCCP133_30950 [Cytobacillus sp. NCCP-133]
MYFDEKISDTGIIESVEEIYQLKIGDRVIFLKGDNDIDDWPEVVVIGDVLAKGEGIGSMFTTGRVFVYNNLNYLGTMERGDILVFNKEVDQNPDLIRRASVIITEEKTLNSLAAVLGLNLSKPMIIGVENIKNLRSGEIVTVDTNAGKIYKGGIKTAKYA